MNHPIAKEKREKLNALQTEIDNLLADMSLHERDWLSIVKKKITIHQIVQVCNCGQRYTHQVPFLSSTKTVRGSELHTMVKITAPLNTLFLPVSIIDKVERLPICPSCYLTFHSATI